MSNWDGGTSFAYGCSASLYEKHPVTTVPAGEPIADCFAIVCRQDSAIMCLADGVNWGVKVISNFSFYPNFIVVLNII